MYKQNILKPEQSNCIRLMKRLHTLYIIAYIAIQYVQVMALSCKIWMHIFVLIVKMCWSKRDYKTTLTLGFEHPTDDVQCALWMPETFTIALLLLYFKTKMHIVFICFILCMNCVIYIICIKHKMYCVPV